MSRLRPADSVHARTFNGELVILDMEHGEYFALDEIGAKVWLGLEAGKPLEELIADIASEYDVTPKQAHADASALRDDLVARGLLVEDGA